MILMQMEGKYVLLRVLHRVRYLGFISMATELIAFTWNMAETNQRSFFNKFRINCHLRKIRQIVNLVNLL